MINKVLNPTIFNNRRVKSEAKFGCPSWSISSFWPRADHFRSSPMSLKVLDPKRPIREADIFRYRRHVSNVPSLEVS